MRGRKKVKKILVEKRKPSAFDKILKQIGKQRCSFDLFTYTLKNRTQIICKSII
jgi:hypothetical protein